MRIGNRYCYAVDCIHCGKEYFRTSTTKDKRYFCTHSCWRQQLLKENDPKGYNILDNIDTPNFSYLIGLICTDGHINIRKGVKDNSGNTCSIQLMESCLYLLEHIQKIFGGYILTFNSAKKYPKWHLSNKRFIEYLVEQVGLTQNKTFTLNPIKWFSKLSDKNKAHFIRGVIDGDGSVYVGNNSRGYNDYKVYITSASKQFLEMLQQHLGAGSITQTQSKAFNLVVSSKNAVEKLSESFTVDDTDIYHKDKLQNFRLIQNKYV